MLKVSQVELTVAASPRDPFIVVIDGQPVLGVTSLCLEAGVDRMTTVTLTMRAKVSVKGTAGIREAAK